ncbi:MAG: fibro-slime family protein [Fibrobacteres bacterium]|nr:fibro-slime family protein [Fibrobacterota bacterium]
MGAVMSRMRGAKLKLMAALILAFAGSAAAVTIHVKNPWPGVPMWTTPRVLGYFTGAPGIVMTDDGDGWFSYTLADNLAGNGNLYIGMYPPAGYDPNQPDFGAEQDLRASGIGKTGTDFVISNIRAVGADVWIIPQGGTKPPIVTDIPQAKKVAFLFNPWPANAPMDKVGGAAAFSVMHPAAEANRCGWYGSYFNKAPFTVSYKSLFGAETYGIGGMGDAKTIDLASYFATSDTIWLTPDPIPGGAPKITTTKPAGVLGTCSFKLAVTVRDFSKDHPDFDDVQLDHHDLATKGMVKPDLDPQNKPQASATPFMQSDFPNWFRDKKTDANPKLNNVTYCKDLPMSKTTAGLWGYNSFKTETSHSFFPLDAAADNTFGETGPSQYIDPDGIAHNDPTAGKHNFNFCMEMHASFKYQPGQEFNFVGDDDTWAFINKKLVMDIGGPHPPVAGKVRLDTIGNGGGTKLIAGTDYPFDFFFCERQPTGSDLAVETSIFFEQQQNVFVKTIPLGNGAVRYEIYEITSGDASCGSSKGGDTTLAKSDFTLSGPSVNPPAPLNVGSNYGGIDINPTTDQITVDTSKVTGLRPGDYLITYTTKSGKGSTLPFHISGNFAIEFAAKPPVNVILNTLVPVTVQATLGGVPDKRAETFHFTPQAGLTVYSDSSLTKPIAAGTELVTDAATGTLKVYVSSAAAGTYKLDLIGGLTKNVMMDTYNNLTFFVQPKVATPTASPGSQLFILPISVTLNTSSVGATIFYTTDGTEPASSATGTTKAYTGPLPLTATTTIKAKAVMAGWIDSDVLTQVYTYSQPLAIKKAWYQDLNGDGIIETVVIDFEKDIPYTPDKLTFKITDASGKSNEKTAAKAEINYAPGSKSRIIVKLASPFDKGVTSVGNPTVSGQIFKQDNIPSLDGIFPVDDSVPPIIITAKVIEPDSTQRLKRILITVSEGVTLPLGSQTALIFKREGVEMGASDVKIHHIEKTGDRDYAVYIDSTSKLFPIVGDSVAINSNGEVKDLVGNSPSVKAFLYMDGKVPAPKPMDLYVTFPNSKKDSPSDGVEPQGNTVFIPVDVRGIALSGEAGDGKCTANCFSGDNTNFVGPVFHILTPGPVRYEFQIFNNHGEFVVKGKGHITEKDLPSLPQSNDAFGVKYTVRVVWTGRTMDGAKAATGAYILQTNLISDKDNKTGAASAKDTKRVTFGLLRSFRGS